MQCKSVGAVIKDHLVVENCLNRFFRQFISQRLKHQAKITKDLNLKTVRSKDSQRRQA